MSVITKNIERHWIAIQPLFSIKNEKEYDLAVERLNSLIDEIGTDESHPLYELLDTLGTLIHTYEEERHPIPDCTGSDILHFLMEQHAVTTSDLSELGINAVEDVLENRRELTLPEIRVLSKRFELSPAVFI
jgi:HTH-type transcriptional regulator/antitoxin HigA